MIFEKREDLISAIALVTDKSLDPIEAAVADLGPDIDAVLTSLGIKYQRMGGDDFLKTYYPKSFKGASITYNHPKRFPEVWGKLRGEVFIGESYHRIVAIVNSEIQPDNVKKSSQFTTIYKIEHPDTGIADALEEASDFVGKSLSDDAYSYVAWALEELGRGKYDNVKDFLLKALKK